MRNQHEFALPPFQTVLPVVNCSLMDDTTNLCFLPRVLVVSELHPVNWINYPSHLEHDVLPLSLPPPRSNVHPPPPKSTCNTSTTQITPRDFSVFRSSSPSQLSSIILQHGAQVRRSGGLALSVPIVIPSS